MLYTMRFRTSRRRTLIKVGYTHRCVAQRMMEHVETGPWLRGETVYLPGPSDTAKIFTYALWMSKRLEPLLIDFASKRWPLIKGRVEWFDATIDDRPWACLPWKVIHGSLPYATQPKPVRGENCPAHISEIIPEMDWFRWYQEVARVDELRDRKGKGG